MARIKKLTGSFTTVPNTWINDNNLSLKAKGLLMLLQSLADGWEFTIAGIATKSKDGVEGTRATIKELKDAGYLKWQQSNNGRFGDVIVELYETPQNTENPLSENPLSEKTAQTNNNITNTNTIDTKVSMAQEPKTEYGNVEVNWAFNTFYDMFGYPMKRTARNTHAVWNMLRAKDKGKDWLVQMLNLWYLSRNDKYSPRISDFYELSQKYDKLMEWGQRAALAKQTEVIQ